MGLADQHVYQAIERQMGGVGAIASGSHRLTQTTPAKAQVSTLAGFACC
ncbi:hypothetical protein IQ265_14615 [Nodosilinea sp. LEGE 06152]|nr:hypothetical protein [Nodosilinea sp. LEGE 06152]MBE9158049.1 hypothetical protein [Nodosilinea sp. LEGE 06152]